MESPVRLCCRQRHFGTECTDGLTMCCLCFNRFEIKDLNITADGKPEDVCKLCAANERKLIPQ